MLFLVSPHCCNWLGDVAKLGDMVDSRYVAPRAKTREVRIDFSEKVKA